jgi:hypothetical protein
MKIKLKLMLYSSLNIMNFIKFVRFFFSLGPTKKHNLDFGTKTKSYLKPKTRTNFI